MIAGLIVPRHGAFVTAIVYLLPPVDYGWAFPVPFLIDTGSPVTCIAEQEVGIKLPAEVGARLESSLRSEPGELRGVGGSVTLPSIPARITFVHEDQRLSIFEMRVRWMRLSQATRGLPSILGRDLLQHLSLHYEPGAGLISLDCAEPYKFEDS